MSLENIIMITVVIVILLGLYLSYIYGKKSTLSKSKKNKYILNIQSIDKETPEKKMIVYDSILHKILLDLGYKGTLGEILKKKPAIIASKINTIWELHKLRNKIAHEIESIDNAYLEKKSKEYKEELNKILGN